MPGCFGLLDAPHQDDRIPLHHMVEHAGPVADVHHFNRAGLLGLGTHARLETPHGVYLTSVREAGILELDGQPVHVSWHPALTMRVFICPRCQCDKYKLYRVSNAWACRKCHALDYECRHRHRTIPGLARLRWLRQRIGASPVPFSPQPSKPMNARKH